jgi:hypothetical protein
LGFDVVLVVFEFVEAAVELLEVLLESGEVWGGSGCGAVEGFGKAECAAHSSEQGGVIAAVDLLGAGAVLGALEHPVQQKEEDFEAAAEGKALPDVFGGVAVTRGRCTE